MARIGIRHKRSPIRAIICGGGGRVWHIADSMQDAAYRITDAEADAILADRAHFRDVVVWSLRAPRTSHGQYDVATNDRNN